MQLLFASQNHHKQKELASLLFPHQIILPHEIGLSFFWDEIGSSYGENALGKAMHLHNTTGKICIADDSGLAVDVLEGKPGIHSARYGKDLYGRELDAQEKNQYLLEKLKDVPPSQRNARFICAMALVVSPYRYFVVQESIEGFIALSPQGSEGFGYDPVFLVGHTEKTMAELSESEKNRVSHRGKAARMMLTILTHLEIDDDL